MLWIRLTEGRQPGRAPTLGTGVRRSLVLVAVLGLLAAVTACVAEGKPPEASNKPTVAARTRAEFATAAVATRITGGSAAERALLREILAALAPTHISQLRLERVRGGVTLQAPRGSLRSEWESAVVGEVFHDRSADQHLPHVLTVAVGPVSWLTADASPRPPHASPQSSAATRRTMRRLARATGARVLELTVPAPDALAVVLRLQVSNAARFLRYRLAAALVTATANESRYEGLYVEVDDARGVAWASGETRLGGDFYVRPSLAGCGPIYLPYPSDVVVTPCPA